MLFPATAIPLMLPVPRPLLISYSGWFVPNPVVGDDVQNNLKIADPVMSAESGGNDAPRRAIVTHANWGTHGQQNASNDTFC